MDSDNQTATNGKNGYDLPRSVGIIYSEVKREYFPTEAQYITEKDAENDAKLVSKYLELLGIKVLLYRGDNDLPEILRKDKPELVINLVDSVKGVESLSSSIPGVLELLDVPYTGADILGLSLGYNKFLVKKLLQQNGIPIPNYQLFNTPSDFIDSTLRYPLISKLNEIHGAVEITKDAVSETEKHLIERLKFLIGTYKQPVLVEEFIVGREITAILLEGLNKKVYLAEKIFNKPDEKYIFATFEDQWVEGHEDAYAYARYEDPILKEYVKKAFDFTKMYDYGKFDVRLDQSGRYFFIDANCNPSFGPKEADAAISTILDLYGISFPEILKRLLLNTMRDSQGKERLPAPS
ncbi:hypothetical protein A2714_04595 [Candidatus Woesebacteria bacterium RIFCSPHIGHO2_01_FULL_38_9]|uniref:ATP-grasp domain-containing protein n=2 Tax=Candidatus Woeseibacteriota TaxID=1752722 RepID=A0A1F7Y5K2_9BACT|nr:MAG: hypothetical protein A2714_04595 [Candidatus Woesebacteria bacterium RIFCSPHIGHO2_01_FULL_38_9]OGM60275.1 MAG: hypothetical protein A3A75_04165 [Candidatus Woesebacteria bacterium RIFCSPLOWO2_01_FULL_39_10]